MKAMRWAQFVGMLVVAAACAGCPQKFAAFPEAPSGGGAVSAESAATTENERPPETRASPDQSAMPTPEAVRQIPAGDPPAILRPTVNLSIFRLSVPRGSVSGSAAFWKRVEEPVVDVASNDILLKNGLRVGRAPLADIDWFLGILDKSGAQARPAVYAASGAKVVEIEMKKDLASQIIYDFDSRDILTMRSYDASENVLVVEFGPAPRKAGDVRVSVVPMVRTLRKRIVPVGEIETREFEFVSPEKYFNVNLKTDVPLDSFLIIAPGIEATSRMSLGHSFLVREAETERLEDVVLLVPQVVQSRNAEINAQK